jgi:DNA-binding CsgD family transcriptional regulator
MVDEEPKEITAPAGVVEKPHNWEKAVSVAYLRSTGDTQEEAATSVGVSERTVRGWEASSWWPDAVAVAHQRWLQGCDQKARSALSKALSDSDHYAPTARWWADRRIPELAPPKTRSEITGTMQHNVQDLSKLTDQELEVAKRLAAKLADDSGDND